MLVPILANSHAGTKYGIPFPVYARAAYGTVGSNLPALMRALVACGWFGINCWIGGQALHTFLHAVSPWWMRRRCRPSPVGGHAPGEWIGLALFWVLNIGVVYRGMDLLRKVENWAAPFVLVMTALLVGWAVQRAHGLGAIMAQPGKFTDFRSFFKVFVPSLTAMIGFWATLSLNMPDFTRFGRSQREQVVGQVVALPTTMTVFAAMGIIITSATAIIYGKAIWDPVTLVGHFEQPLDRRRRHVHRRRRDAQREHRRQRRLAGERLRQRLPAHISFRTGGLITGIVGILMQPWKLLADPSGYIFKWLVGYSGGLGSIAGVLIADYFLVRDKKLALADLYRPDGATATAAAGTCPPSSPRSPAALRPGSAPSSPRCTPVYDYAWFVGFFVAGGAYLASAHPEGAAGPDCSRSRRRDGMARPARAHWSRAVSGARPDRSLIRPRAP